MAVGRVAGKSVCAATSVMKKRPGADVIEAGNQYHTSAQSSLADDRTRVLLFGDTFAVFDRYGDIQPLGYGQQGLFYQETRHLSNLQIHICGYRPLLLSSQVREDNILLAVDLTNPDMTLASGESFVRGSLHIYRNKFLSDGVCFDRFTIHNYGQKPFAAELSFAFGADFADIFEVRGQKRAERGIQLPEDVERSGVTLTYEGLDRVFRRTRIDCSPACGAVSPSGISIPVHLEPGEEMAFGLEIICEAGGAKREIVGYEEGLRQVHNRRLAWSVLSVASMATFNGQ